jgi:lincosamide nucleotidyltransferase A/C/D/E
MMTSTDVVQVLKLLREAGVVVWLDGGWGVDALVHEQTRPHKDLDLVVSDVQAALTREVLSEAGYEHDRGPDWNFVLRDPRGREVDVHTATFDDRGGGHLATEAGEGFSHDADAFAATGSVGGHPVRCLSPEAQMINHSHGYTPGDTDVHDMRLLNERLGTRLLPPYSLVWPT